MLLKEWIKVKVEVVEVWWCLSVCVWMVGRRVLSMKLELMVLMIWKMVYFVVVVLWFRRVKRLLLIMEMVKLKICRGLYWF